MSTADVIARIAAASTDLRLSAYETSAEVALLRVAMASPDETTRPVILDTLTAKADALEQFGIPTDPLILRGSEWSINYAPRALGDRWVLEHDRLTIWAPSPGDVALAHALRDLRHGVRIATIQQGYAARRRLGLPRGR